MIIQDLKTVFSLFLNFLSEILERKITIPFAIYEVGLLVFQGIEDTTLSGSTNAYELKLTNYWVIFVLGIDVKIPNYPIQV
jgi:hypothetical protein